MNVKISEKVLVKPVHKMISNLYTILNGLSRISHKNQFIPSNCNIISYFWISSQNIREEFRKKSHDYNTKELEHQKLMGLQMLNKPSNCCSVIARLAFIWH